MSVSVQAIPQEPSTASLKKVNEFYVPNILAFNLKKTPEDRLQGAETGNPSSRQNGDVDTEKDEAQRMSPKKKNLKDTQLTSSFLLEPFLKPVTRQIKSNKENPVLKALFGGKTPSDLSPWTCVSRTPINNCHPFKKTELSHDIASDETPIQIPKSLLKKPSAASKPPAKETKKEIVPEPKATILKEVQMNSDASATTASGISRSTSSIDSVRSPSPSTQSSPERDKDSVELSIFNKRKNVISQFSLSPPKSRTQYINIDRLIQLRTLVDNAIKNHKVYSMTGCYNSVRNALKQRGWVEKIDNDLKGCRKINRYEEIGTYDAAFQFVQKYQTVAAMRLSVQTNSGFIHNDQIHYTGQGEAEIINKMLKNVTEDLCWLSRPYPYYCWKDFNKFEMVNRLPRAYFSNKIGLCNSLQQIQWFYELGVCSTQYPRTYNVSNKEEIEAFKDDFRLTACIGTLKWFLQAFKSGGEKAVRSPEGKIDMNIIEFALRRCAEFVKTKRHEDIDIIEVPTVWEYQWDQFITQYYKIVNDGQILKDNKEGVAIKAVVSNVQSMINILKPYWPQFDIDGYRNFWIIKPGGRCCGAGIIIKNNLEQILLTISPNSLRESRFVVQKYIERPLLIHNTKFDIRQWFLVTNIYPLTIWMYKECYLRFCSQPFTLKNTHESIHLCNNAVQKKYKNGKRDRALPDENMWDCYTFQTYLKAIGHPEAWEKYIYPGMREGFIGALLTSQESMERKKNCFELYGADFMISDTITDGPWLIEINSNPAMDSSTSVTARMCPQVLEDIIKVVIDRRDNRLASTGAFEMVYKQNCPPIPPYLGMSLCVKGKKAYRSSGDSRAVNKKSKIKKSSETLHYTDTEEESGVEEIISVNDSPKSFDTPISTSSPNDKKDEKILNSEIVKETRNKRRKVDWVRKNIEDLKSIQSLKQSKSSQESPPEKPSPRNKRFVNAEETYNQQILKLVGTLEMSEFLKEASKLRQGKDEAKEMSLIKFEELIKKGMEITKELSNEPIQGTVSENEKISENIEKVLLKISESNKPNEKDVLLNIASNEASENYERISKLIAKNYPNFDVAFEKELQQVEEKEEKKAEKSKSEGSLHLYLSAQNFFQNSESKTSLDYFRDWKSKLHETRRTCEDLLAQLNSFKEKNSKVKFQEVVQKRIKEEVDFLKRIKQRRKCKEKMKKKEKDYCEEKDKFKMEDFKSASRTWDSSGSSTPLAINSENGAVRNINYSLPKIKQRSRSLLPNGCSGHGRKIDVTLEEACCH